MDSVGFTFPPKLYDFLKFVAFVILPALATLFLALVPLIHWDGGGVAAGITTAVDTFLGAVLGKSSNNFAKQNEKQVLGDLVVQQDVDGTPIGMKIIGTQENPILQDRSQVTLNVRREQKLD